MHEFDLHIVRRDGTPIEGCEVRPSDLCRGGRYCDCFLRARRILLRRSEALGDRAWGDAIVHYIDGKAVFLSQLHAPRGRRAEISEPRVWISATISRLAVVTLHEVARERKIIFSNAFALALAMQRRPVAPVEISGDFETVRTNIPVSLHARMKFVAEKESRSIESIAAEFIEGFIRPPEDAPAPAIEEHEEETKEAA